MFKCEFLTKQEVPPFRILAGSLSEPDCEEKKVEKVEEEVRSRDCDCHPSLRIRLIVRSWILNLGSHRSKCLQDCSNLRLSWFHNAAHLQLDPKVDGWEGSKGQGQPERISLTPMMHKLG